MHSHAVEKYHNVILLVVDTTTSSLEPCVTLKTLMVISLVESIELVNQTQHIN